MTDGGTPTHSTSGVTTSLNSFTLQPEDVFTIPHSDSSSDTEADIAAVTPGGSGERPSGLSNVNSVTVHQGTFPNHIPEQFDDPPYVPPRVSQAEMPHYPALDPRAIGVYGVTHRGFQQQYQYEGGTSPSDSADSNWSTASSSPESSKQLLHDYGLEVTSQDPRTPRLPPATAYTYPTYHGQHRFDHARHGEQPLDTIGLHIRYPTFLTPENYGDASTQATIASSMQYPPAFSQASSSTSPISAVNRPLNVSTLSESPPPDEDSTGPYLRQQLELLPHQEVSLRSLPDPPPGEKPSTPLPMLIKLAIYGSPNKRLTLQEIYSELEKRFEWFRIHEKEKAWKNSIRHNLSLNKVFQRASRPIAEPGKGSYWKLDVSGGEGYKRTRKRRPRNKMMVSEGDDGTSETDDRTSPMEPSQHTVPSQSSATHVEDAHIDPELRSGGHVVGGSRSRSAPRRVGNNPYPQQTPRNQQSQLPVVTGQDVTALGQRFGHPGFDFLAYPQTTPMSIPPSTTSFTTMTSSPTTMTPPTPNIVRSRVQQASSHGRTADAQTMLRSQETVLRSSSGPSPSGPSRTWNHARSGTL